MYYFTYGTDIAAVEDVSQAIKYAAAGWRVVSHDTFMDAWKRRDARDLARIWAEVVPVDACQIRAVGERPTNGWMGYSV